MKTLIYYEKRKILRRKSTIIACLLMLLSIIALSFVFVSDQDYYRADSTEVSGMEAIHVKQEMDHALAGPLTAERLKDALQQYHTVYGNSDNFGTSGALKDEVYCKDILPYNGILNLMRRIYSPAGAYDMNILSSITNERVENFYQDRHAQVQSIVDMDYTTGNYTQAEKDTILKLDTQAFQELYYQADKVHQGALPVPVRLMFDEFANVALPDGYARLQATMRSRNIMSTTILQNVSQLKALFKDDWEGIIGNADSFVYLGGNEQSTHKYISELLGKETIDTRTSSRSKGRNGSFSQNFQQTGRELMTPDEVRRLDNKNAIVLIRGEKPVIDETLTYCDFPSEHWTRIRTNNVIERLNREIRRRTRVVGTFPDGNSALMLVCARLRHVAGTQWGNKKYMNMKHLEAALYDASIAG